LTPEYRLAKSFHFVDFRIRVTDSGVMKLYLYKSIFILVLMVHTITVNAIEKPLALVYFGPGSCSEDCTKSAEQVAQNTGYQTERVGPTEWPSNRVSQLFDVAKIWIQPGGQSVIVSKNMFPALKQKIRDFVSSGGGYVGFCAGGFFSTKKVGRTEYEGLGIVPGKTELFDERLTVKMLPFQWMGVEKILYWEGGPKFILSKEEMVQVEVISTYAAGEVAAIRTTYGNGRVFVVGPHPEAPKSWRDYYRLNDSDGLDLPLAEEMVKWAAKP
jgi:glutamine amidotransferase-like uncharacterized protein